MPNNQNLNVDKGDPRKFNFGKRQAVPTEPQKIFQLRVAETSNVESSTKATSLSFVSRLSVSHNAAK